MGKELGYLDFQGIENGDVVDTNSQNDVEIGAAGSISIVIWGKYRDNSAIDSDQTIVNSKFHRANATGVWFGWRNGQGLVGIAGTGGSDQSNTIANPALSEGDEYFVVLTIDLPNNDTKFYFKSKNAGVTAVTAYTIGGFDISGISDIQNFASWKIGRTGSTGAGVAEPLNGEIYKVLFYDDELSSAEVTSLEAGTEVTGNLVLEYGPDGLRPTQNEWIDAQNTSDATVTNAEFKRSPDANKNGVLILKYTSVNARYWYVTVNDEQNTAPNADLELGEITLAKSFQPSVNPNVNAPETQDYSGIDEVQKYGGGIDLNERHGRRRIWTFTWDYLTSADKANFQLMLEQTKKRILYFTPNNDAAFPVLYGARILEAVDINVLNYQAYGLSLTLIEEV